MSEIEELSLAIESQQTLIKAQQEAIEGLRDTVSVLTEALEADQLEDLRQHKEITEAVDNRVKRLLALMSRQQKRSWLASIFAAIIAVTGYVSVTEDQYQIDVSKILDTATKALAIASGLGIIGLSTTQASNQKEIKENLSSLLDLPDDAKELDAL